MTKERQSNFELLRIISMLLVLLIHCDYPSLGMPDVNEIASSPNASWIKLFINVLSSDCVNLFILISGYFAIRPSIKSALNLLFTVLFYRVCLGAVAYIFGVYTLLQALDFMIPGNGDWFIASYVLLMIIAPFLNQLIDYQHENRGGYLRLFIIIFFSLEFCFGWVTRYWKDFAQGYSVISLMNLYMQNVKIKISISIFIYIICSILFASLLLFLLKISDGSLKVYSLFNSYCSPIVIFLALILFLGFKSLSFKSKIINKLAASSFAVFLIHVNPFIMPQYQKIVCYSYEYLGYKVFWCLFVFFIIPVFYVVVFGIDQIRQYLWNLIWRAHGKRIESKIKYLNTQV